MEEKYEILIFRDNLKAFLTARSYEAVKDMQGRAFYIEYSEEDGYVRVKDDRYNKFYIELKLFWYPLELC